MAPDSKRAPDNNSQNRKTGSANEKERTEQPHWISYVEGCCAVLLVMITGTYTYYAAGQLHKLKRATEAAEGANRIASSALQESNRSWIEIRMTGEWAGNASNIEMKPARETLAKVDVLDFPLSVQNIGKFPIKDIRMEGNVELQHADVPVSYSSFHWKDRHPKMGISVLYPNRFSTFDDGAFEQTHDTFPPFARLGNDRKKMFLAGKIYFVIYARGTFMDGFGKHWVEFCSPITLVNTQYRYGDCINYNDIGDGPPPWEEVWP